MKIYIHSNHKESSLAIKKKLIKLIEKSPLELADKAFDLIVVIGGDGTMLSAIRKFKSKMKPFVGINTGTLGFLPSILPDQIEDFIDIIVNRKYVAVDYPLLKLTATCINGVRDDHYAFNEILIKHEQPKLMEAKVYMNNKAFNYFTGDGFIISTAIGATGYAIWAGGVATHPAIDAYQITPLNPNDNSVYRPLKTSMVVPMATRLSIDVVKAKHRKVIVACDGRKSTHEYIEKLEISRSLHHKVTILKTDDLDYFDLYRNKIIDKKTVKML